jgi:hypothetical protein
MALFKNDQQKLDEICTYIREHIDEELNVRHYPKKCVNRFWIG